MHPPSTSSSASPRFAGQPRSHHVAPEFAAKILTPPSMDPCAGPEGSGAHGKLGAVTEPSALGLSPPAGVRQVPVAVLPVTSDAAYLPPQTLLAAPSAAPDYSLGLERIVPVYEPPWAEPLPITTIIPPKDSAVSILGQYLADDAYANATWFTDGSLLKGAAGGAAVWIVGGAVRERILLPLGDGQVAEGEIEGLLRATERALSLGADHILVVSDSQAGLKAITSTSPRAGQFRAIQYDCLVHAAMESLPALCITNLWTPAHISTTGNELTDDTAKAATCLPTPSL